MSTSRRSTTNNHIVNHDLSILYKLARLSAMRNVHLNRKLLSSSGGITSSSASSFGPDSQHSMFLPSPTAKQKQHPSLPKKIIQWNSSGIKLINFMLRAEGEYIYYRVNGIVSRRRRRGESSDRSIDDNDAVQKKMADSNRFIFGIISIPKTTTTTPSRNNNIVSSASTNGRVKLSVRNMEEFGGDDDMQNRRVVEEEEEDGQSISSSSSSSSPNNIVINQDLLNLVSSRAETIISLLQKFPMVGIAMFVRNSQNVDGGHQLDIIPTMAVVPISIGPGKDYRPHAKQVFKKFEDSRVRGNNLPAGTSRSYDQPIAIGVALIPRNIWNGRIRYYIVYSKRISSINQAASSSSNAHTANNGIKNITPGGLKTIMVKSVGKSNVINDKNDIIDALYHPFIVKKVK